PAPEGAPERPPPPVLGPLEPPAGQAVGQRRRQVVGRRPVLVAAVQRQGPPQVPPEGQAHPDRPPRHRPGPSAQRDFRSHVSPLRDRLPGGCPTGYPLRGTT